MQRSSTTFFQMMSQLSQLVYQVVCFLCLFLRNEPYCPCLSVIASWVGCSGEIKSKRQTPSVGGQQPQMHMDQPMRPWELLFSFLHFFKTNLSFTKFSPFFETWSQVAQPDSNLWCVQCKPWTPVPVSTSQVLGGVHHGIQTICA